MSIEFVPIAIRSLMLESQALINSLGSGDDMRVYPVEAPDGAELPYVVYHQMEERLIGSKDAQVNNGWELLVTIHTQDPGAYLESKRIARATRLALNFKESAVLDDDGESFNLRIKYTGQEDITPEHSKDLIIIALAFRGSKIS